MQDDFNHCCFKWSSSILYLILDVESSNSKYKNQSLKNKKSWKTFKS